MEYKAQQCTRGCRRQLRGTSQTPPPSMREEGARLGRREGGRGERHNRWRPGQNVSCCLAGAVTLGAGHARPRAPAQRPRRRTTDRGVPRQLVGTWVVLVVHAGPLRVAPRARLRRRRAHPLAAVGALSRRDAAAGAVEMDDRLRLRVVAQSGKGGFTRISGICESMEFVQSPKTA